MSYMVATEDLIWEDLALMENDVYNVTKAMFYNPEPALPHVLKFHQEQLSDAIYFMHDGDGMAASRYHNEMLDRLHTRADAEGKPWPLGDDWDKWMYKHYDIKEDSDV